MTNPARRGGSSNVLCCVCVVWAKRGVRSVPGRLGKAKRYARDIQLTPDQTCVDSPWFNGLDPFRVPFLFVTNGRPYVKQLATKSGILFWDARPTGAEPRALPEWSLHATSPSAWSRPKM